MHLEPAPYSRRTLCIASAAACDTRLSLSASAACNRGRDFSALGPIAPKATAACSRTPPHRSLSAFPRPLTTSGASAPIHASELAARARTQGCLSDKLLVRAGTANFPFAPKLARDRAASTLTYTESSLRRRTNKGMIFSWLEDTLPSFCTAHCLIVALWPEILQNRASL
jgi:hypothetical protein